MKKSFILMFVAAGLLLAGCARVNLSPLEQRISELEGRLNAVESKVSELNTNASGIKTAVEALEKDVTVSKVEILSDGYKIIFSDKTEAVIKNGAAGGQGPQGPEGPAGPAPTIGVKDVDGVLVWAVNDEPVKDGQGKVIPVTATSAAPEFKYEGGSWYYRIGQGEWVACGAGSGSSDCYIVELADAYMIVMGEDTIVLKKEKLAVPIESIVPKIARVFLPSDKTLDLTEWFDVTPAEAVKSAVQYVYATDAPIAIDLAGKVTADGNTGSIAVNIVASNDENVKATIYVRTGPVVGDEPATSAPADAMYLFKDSYDDFTALRGFGSAATWNPFNGAIAALPGGGASGHNIYFKPQPISSGLTKENGHLYFKWYIKDVTKLVPGSGQIELTSGDNPDAQEMNWSTSFIANCHNGWNEIDLPFKDASVAADFNPNGINWFRFYNETTISSEDPLEVAMVKDVCVYAKEPQIPEGAVQFHSCDNTNFFTKTADVNRTVEIVTTGQKEGTGWYKTTVTKQAELLVIDPKGQYSVNAGNLNMQNGHLVFWFFVSEENGDSRYADNAAAIRARISGNGSIQISSGQGSNKGIYWKTADVFKDADHPIQMGWNKIDLKFSDASVYGDPFTLDTSKLDFFRIYWEGPVALYDKYTVGFDNIYFYAE